MEGAWNFNKTRLRRYRQSLESLGTAVKAFNRAGVAAVLNLGDIIDERNRRGGKEMSLAALGKVLAEFAKLAVPMDKVAHLIGNHECYNLSRAELRTQLSAVDEAGRGYRAFIPAAGWKCVVLDPYEVSTIAYVTHLPVSSPLSPHCPDRRNRRNRHSF